MTKRHKIEFAIAILVLIVLLFLLWFFLRPKPEVVPDVQTPGTQQEVEQPGPPDRISEVDSRTVESPPEVIARSFIERLGSYSTDVDYANVDDVKELATVSLQATLDSVATQARAQAGGAYYGVSTRVITVTPVNVTETDASFLVKTQRTESIDSPANTSTHYQDVEVELIKNGTRWLVNSYAWSE